LLSENIRKCRKSKQMSQDELAEKLGVTRQSISLWETGQTQPSLDNIVALSELFDISTDALLTDKNPESFCAEATESQSEKPKKKTSIMICFVVISALIITVLLWGTGAFGSGNDTVNSDAPIEGGSANPSTSHQLNEDNVPKTDAAEVNSNGNSGQDTAPENTESAVETPGNDAPLEGGSANPSTSHQLNEDNVPKTDAAEVNSNGNSGQDTAPENMESAVETPGNDAAAKDIYSYLKNFVIQNGTVNGDYSYYSKTADHYGGYNSEDFSLYYWGDTKKVEFCLHSVQNDTFSINFYLYVPKQYTGDYEYISSYYYRDTGEPLYEARGVITAEEFTKTYPLNCDKYIGSTENQNEFMEISRQGICDLIDCLKQFTEVEQLKYSFSDFGFVEF